MLNRNFFFLLAAAAGGLAAMPLAGAEFPYRYEADAAPKDADPVWAEGRKSGGGKVTVNDGILRVEIPPETRHFFTLGKSGESERGTGSAAFDASTGPGTTVDFRLAVQADDREQDVFSIQVGDGKGSWHIRFRPGKIYVLAREVEHATTEMDTYRIVISEGKLAFYSAKAGLLEQNLRSDERYPVNMISMGTRAPLAVPGPCAWELDFVRWTNQEAIMAPPEAETTEPKS